MLAPTDPVAYLSRHGWRIIHVPQPQWFHPEDLDQAGHPLPERQVREAGKTVILPAGHGLLLNDAVAEQQRRDAASAAELASKPAQQPAAPIGAAAADLTLQNREEGARHRQQKDTETKAAFDAAFQQATKGGS